MIISITIVINNNVSNLRWATKSENNQNSTKRSDNNSGIKGVYWHRQRQKWCVQIQINGRRKQHLGLFTTLEEAKVARQKASKLYFGEFQNAYEKPI